MYSNGWMCPPKRHRLKKYRGIQTGVGDSQPVRAGEKVLVCRLGGRTEIPVEQANAFGGKSDDVLRVAHRLNERSKDIADCRG